ncbi:MAG: AMP-binding protein [Hyphomicrobiales bacterium]|nr:AMP-binding protein [Hyphomicrobiales bacterium]
MTAANQQQGAQHSLANFGIAILARGAAKLRGDRLCLVEEGEFGGAAITFAEFDRLVGSFAARARECGLTPGERVLVFGAARIGVIGAVIGALAAGLEPVIVPAHADATTLSLLAQSSAATAIFWPSQYGDEALEPLIFEAAAKAPDIRLVASLGPDQCDGAVDFSFISLLLEPGSGVVLARDAAARIGFLTRPRDLAPQIVFLSQQRLVEQALDIVAQIRIAPGQPVASLLSPASLAGFIAGPVAALLAGTPLHMQAPFDSGAMLTMLDKIGPAHLVAPDAILPEIARSGLLESAVLESLALARQAAAFATPFGESKTPIVRLSAGEDGVLHIGQAAPFARAS